MKVPMDTSSTGNGPGAVQMRVEALLRYPVKSMLGETVDALAVDERGAEGDRRLALVDGETGHVASAKNPRLWRDLLTCTAHAGADGVSIRLPDGTDVAFDDPGVDELISRLTGRRVQLVAQRPEGPRWFAPIRSNCSNSVSTPRSTAVFCGSPRPPRGLVHRRSPAARHHHGDPRAHRGGGPAVPAESGDRDTTGLSAVRRKRLGRKRYHRR